MERMRIAVFAAVCATALAGCGDDGGATPETEGHREREVDELKAYSAQQRRLAEEKMRQLRLAEERARLAKEQAELEEKVLRIDEDIHELESEIAEATLADKVEAAEEARERLRKANERREQAEAARAKAEGTPVDDKGTGAAQPKIDCDPNDPLCGI